MSHWNVKTDKHCDAPEVDAFLDELVAVYRKHGMSLSHEDYQGAFIVEKISDENIAWLRAASVDLAKDKGG